MVKSKVDTLEFQKKELEDREKKLSTRASNLDMKTEELIYHEENMQTKEIDLASRQDESKKLEENLENKAMELFSKEMFLNTRNKLQEERRGYLLKKQQQIEKEIKRQK